MPGLIVYWQHKGVHDLYKARIDMTGLKKGKLFNQHDNTIKHLRRQLESVRSRQTIATFQGNLIS